MLIYINMIYIIYIYNIIIGRLHFCGANIGITAQAQMANSKGYVALVKVPEEFFFYWDMFGHSNASLPLFVGYPLSVLLKKNIFRDIKSTDDDFKLQYF